jgi:hypothetical protein
MLDGWRRWDWQDNFRGDLPVLPDLDPVDDHQKWPGRSVLPRIGDRDIDRRIGFRKIMSQADNLELRKVWLKHDRPRCCDIVQLLVDCLVAPETSPIALRRDRALRNQKGRRRLPEHLMEGFEIVPIR